MAVTTEPIDGRAMTDDERRLAIERRDARADGRFVYSVRTTGVYCKPSCPSRRARPENVRYHANPAAAEAAGFRACGRCRPKNEPLAARHARLIAAACRQIETAAEAPTLEALARAAEMSVYHFHRLFRSVVGVTPRAYASAERARRLRDALARPQTSVTAAYYDAGFRSSAGFYGESDDRLGMTPTKYRAGGEQTTVRYAVAESSLGFVLVAAGERGICAIALGDDMGRLERDLCERFTNATLVANDAQFKGLVQAVIELVERPHVASALPFDIRGTAFQERVWAALKAIAPGTTLSYAEIARALGLPHGARAVARACAANNLAIAIPCHRVVGRDGDLAGYRWGVERKRALLEREAKAIR